MEYKFIDGTGGTGLARTALPYIALFALSLMPSDNHTIPQQIAVSYGEYAENNLQPVIRFNSRMSEDEQAKILFSFASRLAENTKDLDVDIAQIISNDFWEMYD